MPASEFFVGDLPSKMTPNAFARNWGRRPYEQAAVNLFKGFVNSRREMKLGGSGKVQGGRGDDQLTGGIMPAAYATDRQPGPNNRVAGLQGLLADLQAFNAGNRPSVTGIGPQVAPTAPGLYAAGLRTARKQKTPGMGLLDNSNAQRYESETGFMPSTTVGGAWGQRLDSVQRPMYEDSNTVVNPQGGRPMLTGPAADRVMNQRGQARGLVAAGDAALEQHLAAAPGYTKQIYPDARPSQATLDANALGYGARRDADLEARRNLRRERGIAEGDSRRIDRGRLTMQERERVGVPGLAVAQEQGAAARGVAGIQAELGEKQIAAAKDMQQAQLDVEKFKAEGNWRQAARAQRKAQRAERELQKGKNDTALGIAGLQTEAETIRAEKAGGLAERQLGLEERKYDQSRADAYGEMARQAEASGQYGQAAEFRALQQQSMGGKANGIQGIQPDQGNAGRRMPADVRAQLKDQFGDDAKGLVDELRRRGLSDQEINAELARIYGESGLGIAPGGYYSRTAKDPEGWGFSQVDPDTGEEGLGLLGTLFSPDSPLFKPRPGALQQLRR